MLAAELREEFAREAPQDSYSSPELSEWSEDEQDNDDSAIDSLDSPDADKENKPRHQLQTPSPCGKQLTICHPSLICVLGLHIHITHGMLSCTARKIFLISHKVTLHSAELFGSRKGRVTPSAVLQPFPAYPGSVLVHKQ